MKNKGFTLIELMASTTVLLIFLGVVSLMITSYMETYNLGVRNEETEASYQTFYAYIINDIKPEDENHSDSENYYVEIKKSSSPNYIEIKRSWYLNTDSEYVRYTYEDDAVSRVEYRGGNLDTSLKQRILKKTKNFDLQGIDIKVSRLVNEGRKKVGDSVNYESVGNIETGVKLSKNTDGSNNNYSYYIEPILDIMKGEDELHISRGYSLRFGLDIDTKQENDDEKSQEDMIWCGEVNNISVKGSKIISEDFKSNTAGTFVKLELIGGDIDRVNNIKINEVSLNKKEITKYSGHVSIPSKNPIRIEILMRDNGNRAISFKYYIYK